MLVAKVGIELNNMQTTGTTGPPKNETDVTLQPIA
jgi:hypothetical protein